MTIYERIVKRAEAIPMPIYQLEKAAGIGNGVIRKWKKKDPRNAVTLRKIAAVLDCTIDDLIEG